MTPRSVRLPGGWPGQLGPFLILGLIAGVLALNWDSLPERWPVHWGIDGQPDSLVATTTVAVYGNLAVMVFACALISLVSSGIRRRSRRLAAAGPAARSEETFQQVILWTMLGLEYFLVLRVALFSLTPLMPESARSGIAEWASVLLGPWLVLLAIAPVLLWMGQGGSRLIGPSAGSRPVGDRTPDAGWKLGLIYFNPEDPAIFVEKRIGIGYTLNFGKIRVWIILTAIVALPMLIRILSRQ